MQHRFYHDQIQSRFKAGVGRGVDLEQAAARVALAESNLTTETANLHDVIARYLRVVGELPPAGIARPASLAATLPASAGEAMNVALRDNAAISASIENLRSARSLVRNRESAYQPRIEARVRVGSPDFDNGNFAVPPLRLHYAGEGDEFGGSRSVFHSCAVPPGLSHHSRLPRT